MIYYREPEKRDIPTSYFPDTPDEVRNIIEPAIGNPNERFRIFYGDPITGKDEMAERDVLGWFSRSNGEQPSPVILPMRFSSIGALVVTNRIIKIIHTRDRVTLYEHPKYHTGPLFIHRDGKMSPTFPVAVYRYNEQIARFPDYPAANRWLNYMTGRRMSY